VTQRLRGLLAATLLAASCTGSSPATTQAPAAPSSVVQQTTTTTADTAVDVPVAARSVGDEVLPGIGNLGYDVDHYTLELEYDPDTDELSAVVAIEATATDTISSLSLDFTGFTVTEVTIDGVPARFTTASAKLLIGSGAPVPAGEGFTVTVAYTGTPQPARSAAFEDPIGWFNTDQGAHVLAEPDVSHTWFPVNDHPSDRAGYTFVLTVPDPFFAAASGTLVSTTAGDGWTTYVWESADAMAPYLATVVVGEYVMVDDTASTDRSGVRVRNVMTSEMAAGPPDALSRQGEMIGFFSDLFGSYPYDEYGIAIVDGAGFGAMETTTLSVFGDTFVTARGRIGSVGLFELVLVHELAHHWFGNHVGLRRWKDIWLNEGFATYAEWLWLEDVEGRAFLDEGIERERRELVEAGVVAPGDPSADRLFGEASYRAGAMVLHALRLTVGDDAFFTTMRRYVDRFGGLTATTDDFIAVAEEVSGRSLGDLFVPWLYGTTLPEFPAP
jgi:aminopeptidase N